jgi:hypothetical protein
MRIGEYYSHKGGLSFIEQNHPNELSDVVSAIESTNAVDALKKITEEKTKQPLLLSPKELNNYLKNYLSPLGWTNPSPNSKKGFEEPRIYLEGGREFREMDGIKNKVGLEIQFGKYAFMGYDIFSKMPIFSNKGLITCGIEVVVMPSLIPHMSTGVSSFSQIVMDMKARGIADIDIPTLIIGMDCTDEEWTQIQEKREQFKTNPEQLIEQGLVNGKKNGSKPGPK